MTIIVMETVNLSLSHSYIRQRLSDVSRKRIRRVYLQKFISDKRQGVVLHNPVYIKRPTCQMTVLSLQNPNRTLPAGKSSLPTACLLRSMLTRLLFPAFTLLYLPSCLRRQRNHSQSWSWQMVIKPKNSQAGFLAWPRSCWSSWRYIFNVNIPGNMSLGFMPAKLLRGLFSPCALCTSFSFLESHPSFRSKFCFMISEAVSNLMTFPKERLKDHATGFRVWVKELTKELLTLNLTNIKPIFGSGLFLGIKKDHFLIF